jgi:hypothetical protein
LTLACLLCGLAVTSGCDHDRRRHESSAITLH